MTIQQMLFTGGSFKATGGVVTTDGTYTYHTFTSDGNFVVESGSKNIDYLIVGAGGAGQGAVSGSGGIGGGGGAGDMIEKFSIPIFVGTFPVIVAPVTIGLANGGAPGLSSSFNSETAIGGGAGGSGDGASGGGAYGSSPGTFIACGLTTGIRGNRGGNKNTGGWSGAGGGGAGGVGGNGGTANGGYGGTGATSVLYINNTALICGGGGGAGETGGGGSGQSTGGNGSGGNGGGGGSAPAYGSGGGGARNKNGFGGYGGNGGGGIVIIRYLNA